MKQFELTPFQYVPSHIVSCDAIVTNICASKAILYLASFCKVLFKKHIIWLIILIFIENRFNHFAIQRFTLKYGKLTNIRFEYLR